MAGSGVEDIDGAGQVVKIRLGRDFKEIASARAAIREYSERVFAEPGHRSPLDDFYLATTEAMNNAVEHSGSNDIGIAVGAAGGRLIFKMITPGLKFDPTVKRTMPDLDSPGELPEGGFGLAIIQELMDSVTYEYREGKNILTLKKIITTTE
jgi:anti-sigma regulatory factor (Ser/Thr protein kinase)